VYGGGYGVHGGGNGRLDVRINLRGLLTPTAVYGTQRIEKFAMRLNPLLLEKAKLRLELT